MSLFLPLFFSLSFCPFFRVHLRTHLEVLLSLVFFINSNITHIFIVSFVYWGESTAESLHFKAIQTQELNPEKSSLSQLVLKLTNLTNSTNTNQSQTSTASHLNINLKIHICNIGFNKLNHKVNYNYIGP